MIKALRDLTPDEQNTMPYEELCAARRRAYREAVRAMTFPPEAQLWAADMAAQHGPIVKVWANHLGWLEALMVVRYGEEPAHWPAALSAEDVARIGRWDKRPAEGLVYLSKEKSTLMAQLMALDEKE